MAVAERHGERAVEMEHWRVGPAGLREKARAGARESAAPTGGAGQSGRATRERASAWYGRGH